MDNEKWTHEVKNNDLADGLEDCKIFENTLDNNLVEKNEENKNEKEARRSIRSDWAGTLWRSAGHYAGTIRK